MEYILREIKDIKFIEILRNSPMIKEEQDALDLSAICGEYGTNRLLIDASHLAPDFFDLKTGLAGAVLQKFATYRVKTAAVIPHELVTGRFREMVIELNRGNLFRIFENKSEAEYWLVSS
jgi:PadR family transcriptional regulator AphA